MRPLYEQFMGHGRSNDVLAADTYERPLCACLNDSWMLTRSRRLDNPHSVEVGSSYESSMQVKESMCILNLRRKVGSEILQVLVAAPGIVGVKMFSKPIIYGFESPLCEIRPDLVPKMMRPVRLPL
jgi:hypothetical protein